MRRDRQATLAGLGAALLLWATAGFVMAADQTVEIADLAFSPSTVTIQAGETVTWINADNVAHTATDADGGFDTEQINPGAEVSVLFDTVGTSSYACAIHPQMTGTVVVQAGAAATAADPGATVAPTDTLDDGASGSGSVWAIVGVVLVALALVVTLTPARVVRRKRP
jgi:plastocyanin